jgi:hypothetical protein
MRKGVVIAQVALALAIAACGGGGDDQSEKISNDSFDGTWPFTVDSGTLRCDGSEGFGSVTFEADGTVYAINGVARQRGDGEDVRPIWKDNPDPIAGGPKVSIGDVINEGLALCK